MRTDAVIKIESKIFKAKVIDIPITFTHKTLDLLKTLTIGFIPVSILFENTNRLSSSISIVHILFRSEWMEHDT